MTNGDPPTIPREHYIPLRKADLLSRLTASESLSDDDRAAFERFSRILDATFHHRFHERLQRLKQAYAEFDPDRDTLDVVPIARLADDSTRREALFDDFEQLLCQANFRQLSEEQLERALNERSEFGVQLHVDLECFEQFAIYVRGESYHDRQRRVAWKAWRLQVIRVPVYQRVAVIFRQQPDDRIAKPPIHVKLFKDIPQADLEMLLPSTTVRMTLLDRGKILMPAISGIAMTAYKLLRGAAVITLAGASGLFATLGLLGGTLGYALKSFFSYLKAKDKYRLHLTQSLYFQNLDNNAGVLFRLLDEAEEQEVRETALAYFLLWQHAGVHGWTATQCDQAAEQWLTEACGRDVDFEIEDALLKLASLDLIEDAGDDRLRAVSIQKALRQLDETWDNFFPYHQPAVNNWSEIRRAA